MSEQDLIVNLTVKEFRELMQQCFNADRAEIARKEMDKFAVTMLIRQGMSYMEAERKVKEDGMRGRQ